MRLRRFIRFLSAHTHNGYGLFLAVFLLSFHQGTILAYSEFGRAAIAANIEQLSDAYIPKSLVLGYLEQLGLGRILCTIATYAIPLFLVQSVPAFIYGSCNSIKDRRTVALIIWLLPAIIGLPTLVITAMYFMSPLFAIYTFPGFMFDTTGQSHKEDFAEGLIFMIAVMGWFHIFWLMMTIKVWLFPRHQS